eukprot:TRINITY_DN4036_c0_g1_i2.p1 TRINITY_DN4036_c0_g1~~TRINITY_DN4036_c0_g1_i2.p1  ORF type:complete len:312 (+),score=56.20 TRINITY_DN4036_c0_g1_i2:34-969(+)
MSQFTEQYSTDDPRLGSILQDSLTEQTDIAIIGFPYDEGVRRNGGRVGASQGPSAFRQFLPKMGTIVNREFDVDLRTLNIATGVDIEAGLALEEAHGLLEEKVEMCVSLGVVPFVVGGGNDQSYPNACGLLKYTEGSIGVVNIDAHFDVRPRKEGKVHSGSPFRELLEDERFQGRGLQFCEFAVQGHQCSAEHWDYLLGKDNTSIIPLSKLRKSSVAQQFEDMLSTLGDNIFVSFDVDSIVSSDCPGVSCPANIGLTAEEACEIAMIAGKNPNVKLMDVSEYNPIIEEYRTGRLLVLIFYYFLLGYAQRKN